MQLQNQSRHSPCTCLTQCPARAGAPQAGRRAPSTLLSCLPRRLPTCPPCRLADLGFDVDIGPLFMTPAEVARHAVDAGEPRTALTGLGPGASRSRGPPHRALAVTRAALSARRAALPLASPSPEMNTHSPAPPTTPQTCTSWACPARRRGTAPWSQSCWLSCGGRAWSTCWWCAAASSPSRQGRLLRAPLDLAPTAGVPAAARHALLATRCGSSARERQRLRCWQAAWRAPDQLRLRCSRAH